MFKNVFINYFKLYNSIILSMLLQYNILENIILFNSCAEYNDILYGLYY